MTPMVSDGTIDMRWSREGMVTARHVPEGFEVAIVAMLRGNRATGPGEIGKGP